MESQKAKGTKRVKDPYEESEKKKVEHQDEV